MGKLECFAIPGIELWFFSQDHLPTHFHAKRKGQWEVRVFFLEGSTSKMFQVVWIKVKEVQRVDLKLLEEKVAGKRAELLEEWERKVLPQ
jgi:Domain of unknown function (DUF4160)